MLFLLLPLCHMISCLYIDVDPARDRFTDSHFKKIRDVISLFNRRVSGVLPFTKDVFDEYNHFMEKNALLSSRGQASQLAKRTTVDVQKQNVSWIEENGICLEKIRPNPSTIDGAGLGAFAQITIPKGDIISPAPLLNIPNRDSLLTYRTKLDEKGTRVKIDDNPIGHQLLLNYCFGHEKSQLLFCPETNAVLINHCRQGGKYCNGNSPNAKVQWAGQWDPTTNEWLQKSTEDIRRLTAAGSRGLSLEIIATRDIKPGEEVGAI